MPTLEIMHRIVEGTQTERAVNPITLRAEDMYRFPKNTLLSLPWLQVVVWLNILNLPISPGFMLFGYFRPHVLKNTICCLYKPSPD